MGAGAWRKERLYCFATESGLRKEGVREILRDRYVFVWRGCVDVARPRCRCFHLLSHESFVGEVGHKVRCHKRGVSIVYKSKGLSWHGNGRP